MEDEVSALAETLRKAAQKWASELVDKPPYWEALAEAAMPTLRAALAPQADGAGEVEAGSLQVAYYRAKHREWQQMGPGDRYEQHDAIGVLFRALDEERARRVEVEGANERRDAKIRRLVEAGLCQMTTGGKHNFLDDIHKLIGADLIATHKDTQDE